MKDQGRLIFHISQARIWSGPAVFLGIGVLVLVTCLLGGDSESATAGLVVFAVCLGFGILFLSLVLYTRLILDDDGITLKQIGYTIHSTWDNVEVIDLTRGNEAIILKSSGVKGMGGALLRGSVAVLPSSVLVGGPRLALAEGRAITLAPFMAHYRRGPLREALGSHLPKLALA